MADTKIKTMTCIFSFASSQHQRDNDWRGHLDPLRQGDCDGHRHQVGRNRLEVQVVRFSGRRKTWKVHGGCQVSTVGIWITRIWITETSDLIAFTSSLFICPVLVCYSSHDLNTKLQVCCSIVSHATNSRTTYDPNNPECPGQKISRIFSGKIWFPGKGIRECRPQANWVPNTGDY